MKTLLIAAALAVAAPAVLANPAASMAKAGCTACHAVDRKLVGPAHKDIATKYKGQDVMARLMQKVRTGGKGVWGPVPMPPSGPDKIADADLKAAIEWMLAAK